GTMRYVPAAAYCTAVMSYVVTGPVTGMMGYMVSGPVTGMMGYMVSDPVTGMVRHVGSGSMTCMMCHVVTSVAPTMPTNGSAPPQASYPRTVAAYVPSGSIPAAFIPAISTTVPNVLRFLHQSDIAGRVA